MHPTDSEEWKEFNLQHPDFSLKPCNVWLGFATDGFNPFGNMNNNYSTAYQSCLSPKTIVLVTYEGAIFYVVSDGTLSTTQKLH